MEENRKRNIDSDWKKSPDLRTKFDHWRGFLPLKNGDSVLDVAGGTGDLFFSLKKWGGDTNYHLMEASPEAIKIAQAKGIKRTTLCDVDGVRLPFEDDSFDIVVLSHVLEHIRNPWVLLAESARISRTYVFVKCPNFVWWRSRIEVLMGNPPRGMRSGARGETVADDGRHLDHIYFMTHDNCIYWARRLGLKVVKDRAWWYRRYAPFRWFLEPLFKNFGEGFETVFEKPKGFSIPADKNLRA